MSETLLNTNQNQLNNDDGSFVELIQTVQNGKAKLAQAIIDKGGNVSVASSYDQMAQAVNNLQVADGKGSFLVQGFYDLKSSGSYNVLDLISATFLPHHNALVGITTEGKINIYRVNDSGNNLIIIASVSTGLTVSTDARYINFGFNRSETKIVFYDNTEANKFLVVMSMNWTTNTLEILLNYTVQEYMGGGNGRGSTAGSGDWQISYSNGILINESGSHIAYLSSKGDQEYLSILIPDYNTGTVEERVGYNKSDYSFYVGSVTYIANSIYYLDIENNIIEGIDPYSCLFKFEINLIGTYPKITNYINTHPMSASNYESQCSYPLIIKDIDSTLDCYAHYIPSSTTKGTLYLKKYTGNEDVLYDKITFNTNMLELYSTYPLSVYQYKLYPTSSYYHINYYIKNNEIYLLLPSNIIVKIDKSGQIPKLTPVSSNDLTINTEYLIRNTAANSYSDANAQWYAKLYSQADSNKIFYISRNYLNSYIGNRATAPSITDTANYFMEYREPCVLAQKYVDSQGNEYFNTTPFNMSTYESGGYRLYEEASILTEDE